MTAPKFGGGAGSGDARGLAALSHRGAPGPLTSTPLSVSAPAWSYGPNLTVGGVLAGAETAFAAGCCAPEQTWPVPHAKPGSTPRAAPTPQVVAARGLLRGGSQ